MILIFSLCLISNLHPAAGEENDLYKELLKNLSLGAEDQDINKDGTVDLYDFVILTKRMLKDQSDLKKSSPIYSTINSSKKNTKSEKKPVFLTVFSNGTIRIEQAEELFGIQIILRYDPSKIKIIDADPKRKGIQIKTGDFFKKNSFIAWNRVYESKGEIVFIGIYLGRNRPPNSGLIAKVIFEGRNPCFELASSKVAGRKDVYEIYVVSKVLDAPLKTCIFQNYPNPAIFYTNFPYQLSYEAEVKIRIYNISGQLIKGINIGRQKEGYYLDEGDAYKWDLTSDQNLKVASGVYFYQVFINNRTFNGKLVVVK
jgi:hypothetical protein